MTVGTPGVMYDALKLSSCFAGAEQEELNVSWIPTGCRSVEDYAKPITEVLYEHPGEDAWCILSKARGTPEH